MDIFSGGKPEELTRNLIGMERDKHRFYVEDEDEPREVYDDRVGPEEDLMFLSYETIESLELPTKEATALRVLHNYASSGVGFDEISTPEAILKVSLRLIKTDEAAKEDSRMRHIAYENAVHLHLLKNEKFRNGMALLYKESFIPKYRELFRKKTKS